MGVKIDTRKLESELIKYMKVYSKTYAKEASVHLTRKAETCIQMFYRDYTPKYYNRTFDLRDNSCVPYFHNNGNAYYGGGRITSEFMSPYYSGGIMNYSYTDPFTVAQLGWHGWHGDPTGYNGRFSPIKTTSPLDVLTDFFNNESFRDILKKRAKKVAMNQNYKYLNMLYD